ncbi:hypothetical protein niasHS_006376 [Heterodera schachtii]|uniref:Cadherin domain-containing protein n=1 Tax=Heterodera schachtii TaxID=97005 RepID=A0ABD2JWJ9_HETSC
MRVDIKYWHEMERIGLKLEVLRSGGKNSGENLKFIKKFDPNGDINLEDENEIGPCMELGRVEGGATNGGEKCAENDDGQNGNKFELLWPGLSTTMAQAEELLLRIDANGSISLGEAFFRNSEFSRPNLEKNFPPERPVELLVRAANCDQSQHTYLPVRLWLPNLELLSSHSQQVPLPSSPPVPKAPLALPETILTGSYLHSVDFADTPRLDNFRLQIDERQNGTMPTTPVLALARRANSIVVRTARPLNGILARDRPIEVRILEHKSNTQIGQFSLKFESAAPCQPRFSADQPLRFSVDQDALRHLPDSSPWLSAGQLRAEFVAVGDDSSVRDRCNPLLFSVLQRSVISSSDHVAATAGQSDNAATQPPAVAVADAAVVRVEPTSGLLSVHARAAEMLQQIMLTVTVRSGAYQAKKSVQILVRRPNTAPRPPLRFAGVPTAPLLPLLLDIDERAPVGNVLTTVRAVSESNDGDMVRYRIATQDDNVKALAEIDAHSGELRLLHSPDFEALPMDTKHLANDLAILNFSIKAQRDGDTVDHKQSAAELDVQLRIHDINDNAPVFDQSNYEFVVERTAPVGTVVGRVSVRDADACDENNGDEDMSGANRAKSAADELLVEQKINEFRTAKMEDENRIMKGELKHRQMDIELRLLKLEEENRELKTKLRQQKTDTKLALEQQKRETMETKLALEQQKRETMETKLALSKLEAALEHQKVELQAFQARLLIEKLMFENHHLRMEKEAKKSGFPSLHLLSCDFHYAREVRHVNPPELAFKLDTTVTDNYGSIWLRAPVDRTAGALFCLAFFALDGKAAGHNATANHLFWVWVCDESDIVSLVVARNAVEMNAATLSSFLSAISLRTRPARPLLHALRHYPAGTATASGASDASPSQAAKVVMQVCFVNDTHVVSYEAVERTLRDADTVEGIDGFEQNLFMASSSWAKGGADFLGANRPTKLGPIAAASRPSTFGQILLTLALIFGALFFAVGTTVGVLLCQHRRRFEAEKRWALAAGTIRAASAHADCCSSSIDNLHVSAGAAATVDEKHYTLAPYHQNNFITSAAAAFPSPPPLSSSHNSQKSIAKIWRRPLPPAPFFPPSADGTFYHQHQTPAAHHYYSVQEMKINL